MVKKVAKTAPTPQADNKKAEALNRALAQIETAFGKGAVMRLGQNKVADIEAISTGSLSLDIALGIGGLPMGRIVEIYGPESSGKTTLTLEAVAQAQKKGKTCAFIDAEHALDPTYAQKLGVKIEDLLISQPDSGEQALEICELLVRSGGVDLIVIDSVAALVPKAEIEGDMGDNHVGLHARLMSQALRKLTGIINQAKCMVIFINQLRMKIGVVYGNPETTTGGTALKYYASVRLDIRKKEVLKVTKDGKITKEGKDAQAIGSVTAVRVVKNKVAPPFKSARFWILYNKGIAKNNELLELGVTAGILNKSGSWLSYGTVKLGNGALAAMRYLDEHQETADEIEQKIRAYYKDHDSYGNTVDVGGGDAAGDLSPDSAADGAPGEGDGDDTLGDADLITPIPDDL